ncbi:hypothetical protein E2C01_097865 [Portunus trituberculatus]|uniref:Uncharacterized protein n=1 Tax=Portunus trituberculatus TaxID=210409 RepID=A0A5B7K5H5_PORTR|nr:hypothetical protein [Portunus trituberculatus]
MFTCHSTPPLHKAATPKATTLHLSIAEFPILLSDSRDAIGET